MVARGWGLFPLHLDWLTGSLFVDGGNAWGPELMGFEAGRYNNPLRDPLVSVGGEITARILPFWFAGMDLRLGVGVPLADGDGARLYMRLGPSF
jgi:hypothetical protein